MAEKRPIILVTGANGGVGFGVCHRLLIQLSQTTPPDASPKAQKSPLTLESTHTPPYTPASGATLILACRSQKRAEVARGQLLQLLDDDLARKKAKGIDVQHGELFRKNLDVQVVILDLSSVEKVFACAEDVKRRFPYVSHMVLNAGVGSFTGINWPRAVYELCTSFKTAITAPGFKLQAIGEVRALRDLLVRNPYGQSRIMWMSSLEGRPSFFSGLDDWQHIKATHSYEASKYSTELLACTLDRVEAKKRRSAGDAQLRHFVVHPGVAATNIFIEHTGWLLDKVMILVFYIARALGSTHHVITPYKAAISSVHIALVSLAVLPSLSIYGQSKQRDGQPPSDAADDTVTRDSDYQAVRYGSEANPWGKEYVGVQPVEGWEEHKGDGQELLARCDRLFDAFERKRQLA